MQTLTLTRIPACHARKITPAIKKRLEKMQSHVLDNPGCSHSDIYKNSGATTNYEDYRLDIDYLVSAGDLIHTKATKKFFKKPIKNGFQGYFLLHQTLNDIANISQHNPSLQKTKIAIQLKQMAKKLNESNISNLTNIYKHGIDHTMPEGEQLLYKGTIIFVQQAKIFSSEIKRLGNIQENMRIRLHKHRKIRLELEKERTLNENTLDKNSVNTRGIRKESKLRDMLHESDWKNYESLSKRIDDSLESLNAFGDFLRKLFMFYSVDPKYLCSDHMETDELSAFFDQAYDDGKKYQSTLKSTTGRSLKELVEIQNMIYLGCDKNILAIRHGYKNKDTMLKSLKKIHDNDGNPDFTYIARLQRIESKRILVPDTSDEEIYSLAQNFGIAKGIKDMKLTSQEKKAEKILQNHKPYSPTG